MESRKPKMNNNNNNNHNHHHHKQTGRSKNGSAAAACKKHPKHRQSPGVCSICLGEKLLHLTNNPTTSCSRSKPAAAHSPYSSSSSYLSSLSSSNASSYSSPIRRFDSVQARKSTRVFKNVDNVLKKSRSMAFVLQRRKEGDENGKSSESKSGFWSKLLQRRNKGLMHSRTTRERVITTAVLH
ncbi:uncharacterized protein DDB_G0287625 [Sesamum indicum]|uniref:Uncharacterized protein DDB_G0287625 n=1 Tax=Sesamum indicum TaxID=4182 RepID=A0A6I9TWV5_SESIN|nr:uncharacterized protein DDB_G0287625 [Sesamum indicum]